VAEVETNLPAKHDAADTIEERLTKNAYQNILPARYLQKNSDGVPIEDPEDLFVRVARNIAVAEAVFSDESVEVGPDDVKPDHPRRDELVERVWDESDPGQTIELTEEIAPCFAFETVRERAPPETRDLLDETAAEFRDLMESLEFMPNSPTLMNAGDELQQLSACFVDSPEDDIDDIHQTAKEAAQVFQSGGGMGYAFWRLRPYGDSVGSTGGIASGPITFMRTYDQMCETIAQGGARRGAQMGVMRVSHPDVIQFIHAKNKDVSLANTLRLNDPDDFTHTSFGEALDEARDLIDDGKVPKHLRNAVEGHLSNFNISVGITDGFMDAVRNDDEFTFTNPRTGDPHVATSETLELYSRFGLGDYVEVGEELSVPAREIWDDIVEGAHQNGEPGVIFLERVNKDHSFDVEEHPDHQILATNPCGEQPLEEYEACNLGHINLSTIVDPDAEVQDWRSWESDGPIDQDIEEFLDQAIDWDDLDRRIELGTRFLENVVTMSDFPVPEIEEKVREMRKIGLGIMGYAQLLIQLGVQYGSPTGNEIARQLMEYINHESKRVSSGLARDRGVFSEWEKSKYADPTEYREWFERQTGEDANDWSDGFPIRNHNTTTIAPTGTTSMIGNTTGGCEPIYNVAFYKNVSDDVQGDEMLVEFDDYFLRVLEENDIDVEAVKSEAERQMSENVFDGISGLDRVPDSLAELFVTTEDLSGIDHASVQCAFQEGVDSAISKTCNLPSDATKEDMEDVYQYIYEHGGKGVTVYRDGTRSKQVKTVRSDNTDFADEESLLDAVEERAETDPEFVSEVVSRVADEEIDPEDAVEEMFGDHDKPWYENGGYAEKRDRPTYLYGVTPRLDTGYGQIYVTINVDESGRPFEVFNIKGESGGFTNGFVEALAKTVSIALRSGVDPSEIADDLIGIRAPEVGFDSRYGQVQSIPDAVGKALREVTEGDIPVPTREESDFSFDREIRADGSSGSAVSVPIPCFCDTRDEMDLVSKEGCEECQTCGWSKC